MRKPHNVLWCICKQACVPENTCWGCSSGYIRLSTPSSTSRKTVYLFLVWTRSSTHEGLHWGMVIHWINQWGQFSLKQCFYQKNKGCFSRAHRTKWAANRNILPFPGEVPQSPDCSLHYTYTLKYLYWFFLLSCYRSFTLYKLFYDNTISQQQFLALGDIFTFSPL